nr:transposase [Photobacterium profundum]
MSSRILRCATLLEPLYMRLKTTLLAEPAIHADETPLKVIKAEKATSYMWVYCCGADALGSNTNIVLFDYHNSRRAQCALVFLMVTKVTCTLMDIKLMNQRKRHW